MVDIVQAFSLQARSRRNALAATHALRRSRADGVAAEIAVAAAASGPPGHPQHDLRRPPPPLAQR